jgi:hypothetical protein
MDLRRLDERPARMMRRTRASSSRRLQRGAKRVAAAALAALCAMVAPRARAQEDLGEPGVTKTASGYAVNVNNADLARVLAAIGGRQGFSVVDEGKNRQPLTIAIDDSPLDQTLRRLLRSENYVIVYRGGEQHAEIQGDAIERIILLSPAGSAPAAKTNASPLAGPQVGTPKPGAPGAPGVATAVRQGRANPGAPIPENAEQPETVPAIGVGLKPPQGAQQGAPPADQNSAAAAAAMARMRGATGTTAVQVPGDPTVSAVADAYNPPPGAPRLAPPAAPAQQRPTPPDAANDDDEE